MARGGRYREGGEAPSLPSLSSSAAVTVHPPLSSLGRTVAIWKAKERGGALYVKAERKRREEGGKKRGSFSSAVVDEAAVFAGGGSNKWWWQK